MSLLITVAELPAAMARPDVVVLDASFTMPGAVPDAAALYAARHIPGAVRFDIDAVADRNSALPHMLPAPAEFAAHVGRLGISNQTEVVIYDTPGLMSAGRAWWMFRTMGHARVRVLDGGLRAWTAAGGALTEVVPVPSPCAYVAAPQPQLVRDLGQMQANLHSGAAQVLDARAAPRFRGEVAEPRPGLRSGHMPGSLNLPYDQLSDPDTGRLRPAAELRRLFAAAGVRDDRPVVVSCGSGVTAGALYFALAVIGRTDVALYDGSWAEWGASPDCPVVQG